MNRLLRELPQVQHLLSSEAGGALVATYGHGPVVKALRSQLQALRESVLAGEAQTLPPFDTQFFDCVAASILVAQAPSLRSVINATGVIVHTNLGRSPLAPEALEAISRMAKGYSNLEVDLASGRRGSRYDHVEALICELTGAEAAIVVNNCAAAVMICLAAFATGKDVVVSRGELVEIGGAFRLPDVISQSGANLKEVGATNKTRASDFERAIGEDTAILFKSHTSNFRMIGFTSSPPREELSALAQAHGVLYFEDLGSGVLVDLSDHGLPNEPVVSDVLGSGADIVMFSGDKLLGGPQAGIIAGRADLLAQIRSHPSLRAVRIDKLSLAALEATLRLYMPPNDPLVQVPVLRMLCETPDAIEQRAITLQHALSSVPQVTASILESVAYAGGGSLPGQDLPSFAVAIEVDQLSPGDLAARLRDGNQPVLARIKDRNLLLDVRAVPDSDVSILASCVSSAVSR